MQEGAILLSSARKKISTLIHSLSGVVVSRQLVTHVEERSPVHEEFIGFFNLLSRPTGRKNQLTEKSKTAWK